MATTDWAQESTVHGWTRSTPKVAQRSMLRRDISTLGIKSFQDPMQELRFFRVTAMAITLRIPVLKSSQLWTKWLQLVCNLVSMMMSSSYPMMRYSRYLPAASISPAPLQMRLCCKFQVLQDTTSGSPLEYRSDRLTI